MSTLVLSEKPSVARDLARILGAKSRNQGYFNGNGYIVTWALGHLVHFAEPDEYGPPWNQRWSFAQLPMIPQKWKLKTARATSDQYKIVKKLLNDPQTKEVICATDAGREGEHIFRLIYEHTRCRKPFKRLWVSSLTDAAIQEGFRTLQEGTAFDDLAQAARARTQADWLMGMNLTRAYTVHNKVLCTIGRVQTPTLAMIVKRDAAITDFVKSYFYELVAHFVEGFAAKYSRDGQTRIDNKEEAERLHRQFSPHKVGIVRKIEQEIVKHRPPPFYDLNNLQRDANRRFGFTAAQVLEHAQALYETHKLITYPRTESRHISEDMVAELPGILAQLAHPQAAAALERLRNGHRLSKAYVDRTKLTDHHAIIPTGQKPSPNLSPALKKIYDLVVTRFVAVFLPDQVVEETTVTIEIGNAIFVAKGSVVLEEGWKVTEAQRGNSGQDKGQDDDAQRQMIPPLEQGQQIHIKNIDLVEKETKPPRPYTDATLLAAMKNAGREIADDELAAAMKESGLGTPATRAETIEKLIRTGYVVRTKKSIASTEKGRALVGLVTEPLRSPELTAEWEQQLKDIEEGIHPAEEFYDRIATFVRNLVPEVSQGQALTPEQAAQADTRRNRGRNRGKDLGACPKCKEGKIYENAKLYGCSRYKEGCEFALWKTVARKKLTEKQAQSLIAKGRSEKIKGFTSKAGKKFEARLKLDDAFKVVFDFDERPQHKATSGGSRTAPPHRVAQKSAPTPAKAAASQQPETLTCPKCDQGQIIEGQRGFGCNRYREGCNFVVWKEMAGKKLTEKQIQSLIAKGRTGLIKGFKGKDGNKFSARLELDEGLEAKFDFAH